MGAATVGNIQYGKQRGTGEVDLAALVRPGLLEVVEITPGPAFLERADRGALVVDVATYLSVQHRAGVKETRNQAFPVPVLYVRDGGYILFSRPA